jgi:hypothetical protein
MTLVFDFATKLDGQYSLGLLMVKLRTSGWRALMHLPAEAARRQFGRFFSLMATASI